MRVRIVRKLANFVNGIDLSHCTTGDLIDVPEWQARLMVAERWADFARRAADGVTSMGAGEQVGLEGRRLHQDRRRAPRPNDVYQRLRDKREQIEQDRRRLQRRATDHGHTHAA